MEYSVGGLAKLAGVSTRTLRHYDAVGLLSPRRVSNNNYRTYGPEEVARLQQILLYREMGVPLGEIRSILAAPGFDSLAALQKHLQGLRKRKEQLEILIRSVERAIASAKGETEMKDGERFEGFKKKLVQDNETKYGKEARAKYGDGAVDASNAKLMGLTPQGYAHVQELSARLNVLLKVAMREGDPAGAKAQEAAALHREWLGHFWNDYSKEAHAGLAQTYVDDPRFKKYYDDIAPGLAVFLRDAILVYCAQG